MKEAASEILACLQNSIDAQIINNYYIRHLEI